MLGRYWVFRYEIRCWEDGMIPDVEDAVASPRAVSRDPEAARLLLALVPQVPALTWGRDEMRTRRDVELELPDRLAARR